MNSEINDEHNNTMDAITRDTPNISTMSDLSRQNNVTDDKNVDDEPVGNKTVEDKTTDDITTGIAIEKHEPDQVMEDYIFDTNVVLSSSDKVSSDKISMDNNIIQAESDEIQVANSQIQIERTVIQNNSSPSGERIRSPKKLENFFKKNQKSPLRKNYGVKPWSGDTSRNLQDNLITNSKAETEDETNNGNANLDTQEEIVNSNIKSLPPPNISSSPKGNILDDFDVSPPDTPESQRIVPNENLENIKDLIRSPSVVNDNEKDAIESIETSKLHTDDIFPLGNKFIPAEDLTTQLIVQPETSKISNKEETSQPINDKLAKVSLNINRNLNFVLGQTTQEQIESVESLIETNVAKLDKEHEEVSKEDATDSNHWRFQNAGNEQELETYDKTTQLIRQPTQDASKNNSVLDTVDNTKPTQTIPALSTQMDNIPDITDEQNSKDASQAEPHDSMAVVSEMNEIENTTTELKSQNGISTNNLNINDDSLNNTVETQSLRANDSETLNRSKAFQLDEISEDSSPIRGSGEHTSYNGPLEKSLSNVSSPKPAPTTKKRKFMKITYAKDSEQNEMNDDVVETLGFDKSNLVVSDFEATQEVPDVPDPDFEDSQKIVVGRNKSKRFISNLQLSEEHEQSEKSSSSQKQSSQEYPNAIRESDDRKLTRKDVIFHNAVWCQYENFHYYPGIIRNIDRSENKYEIKFEADRYIANPEQLYYLDITVGDTVRYQTSQYVVVSLECQTRDPTIIRCIRGYDTLNLKKSSNSENFITVPLSWVYLNLDDWLKRRNIPLIDDLDSDINESEDYKSTAVRKTRTNTSGTPRKKRKVNYAESDNEPDNVSEAIESPQFDELENNIIGRDIQEPNKIRASPTPTPKTRSVTPTIGTNHSDALVVTYPQKEIQTNTAPKAVTKTLSDMDKEAAKIFEGCLFVITGYREIRDELKDTIISYGGHVIDTEFLDLFSFCTEEGPSNCKFQKYSTFLRWKNKAKYSKYRFACVISDRYLRSPKYLEALALRWPTLQRKFVDECIFAGKVDESIICRYLLPSGESKRVDYMFTTSFIKSNSTFQFLTNFVNKRSLVDQISHSRGMMDKFAVIICQESSLSRFAKFLFACFGVKQLVELSNINYLKTTNSSFLQIRSTLQQFQDEDYRLLFYVNDSSTDNSTSRTIESIKNSLQSGMPDIHNYYIKDKEWLIQSVINEDTELS